VVPNSSANLKEIRDVSAPVISSLFGSFLMVKVSLILKISIGKAQRKQLNASILEFHQSAARETPTEEPAH